MSLDAQEPDFEAFAAEYEAGRPSLVSIRLVGDLETPVSAYLKLSRGRAGTLGRCVVINTPGSPKGALESVDAVLDVLAHALQLLGGEVSPHPPDTGGTTATSS